MAHRALVAYRDDGGYHLHYAHWGAKLAEAISADSPLGGRLERRDHRRLLDALVEQFDLDPSAGYESTTRVDPRPLARHVGPTQLLAAVDRSIESLVVVEPDCQTRTYLVCSLGIDDDGPLVLAGPTDETAQLRQTVVTVTEHLGSRVDSGALDAEQASSAVRQTLAVQVPVHALDDASFLSPD